MNLWSDNWGLLILVCILGGQVFLINVLLVSALTRLNKWLAVLERPQSRVPVDPRWRDDR